MISLLSRLARVLDDLQRRRWFRVALSVVICIAVLGYAGAVSLRASEVRRDAERLFQALVAENLNEKDPLAVEFTEKGTVTLEGRTFGMAKYAPIAKSFYDKEGKITNPGAAVRMLIDERMPRWAPTFILQQNSTLLLLTVVTLALLLTAVWTGLAVPMLLTLVGAFAVAAVLTAVGAVGMAVAIASIATLLLAFAILVRAAAAALGRPQATFAIASNVLREALRLRIATFFVVTLLILIPLLPLWISPQEPLRYQIQSFLARSMGLHFFLAACMTVFLACATVSFEIRDRQIWQLMTKPVARVQYLLGKWLGVTLLNLILIVLGGIAIFTYVQYLQTRSAKDPYDLMAVHEEVLVARDGRIPKYRALTGDEAREIVEKKLAADPLLRAEIESGERSETEVLREMARQTHQEFLSAQRRVAPGETREFVFDKLQSAKRLNAAVTLRYAFDIASIDPHTLHPVIFVFPDGYYDERQFVPAQAHVLQVPPQLISEDGTLSVKIINGATGTDENGNAAIIPGVDAIRFKGDQLEVLYQVDTFEWNFVRAMAVQFVKLSFLAMFGVCAATVLSFPVACMLTFTILAIGAMAPFLGISLSEYRVAADAPAVWQAFQMAVKGIATGAEWLLRSFGETSPTARLVEGRVVSWPDLLRTLLLIGAVWTGGAFALGYAAFRRKELATYSGNT